MNTPQPIRTILFFILLIVGSSMFNASNAQAVFQTTGSGSWNTPGIWSLVSGSSATGYPVAGDDAIITGGATITVNSQQNCRNLLIDINSANTINIGPLPFFSLTVNGTMAGWDLAGYPNAPVVGSSINQTGTLIFTGSDINGLGTFFISNEVIAYWNNTNTIGTNVIFNVASSPIAIDYLYTAAFAAASIDFSANVTVNNGTLQNGSNSMAGFNVAGTSLTISSGATLDLTVPVTSDGANSINQISISGTVTTSSYINANTFGIAGTGVFNTAYSGTEGWWSGANRPTSFTINDASLINYNSSSNQNVFPRQYGRLWLSNGGTKTLYYDAVNANSSLVANGNMLIANSVTFNCNANPNPIYLRGNLSNTGTWTPNKNIIFDGTGTQSITGTGTNFSSGITIGDGSTNNTVTISAPQVISDVLISSGATFNTQNNNLTVSGNWSNSGTFTGGTSVVTFNGTTIISGSTDFANASISGSVDVNTTGNTFADVTLTGTGVLACTRSFSVDDLINNGTINGLTSTISFTGSFTNNGTYNRGTSTLLFNGSDTQNLAGSSTTNIHNLTISNTNPSSDVVNINSNVNLYNILTLNSNGRIDADGSTNNGVLTLISQNNGTAKIGPIGSSAVFDGNITMQRRIYPDIGARGWRFISTPLRNQTLADWSDDFSIQGVIGGPIPSGDPITFTYDETSGTDPYGIDGWAPFSNITDGTSGKGIRVFFFDSQISNLILDNTGPPVIGDGFNSTVIGNEKYIVNLDFTPTGFDGGGWNLVGNPYPCEVDFEHVISASGKDAGLVNVNNGIYIWDPTIGTSGNYRSYVSGVGTNNATQYIASGQSFFVKANNSGASISFIENDKVTNQGNTFIREGVVDNVLMVNIVSGDGKNFDQTAIRFKEGSSEAFEKEFDAYKLPFGVINISSLPEPDLDLSINTVGAVTSPKSIKFRLAAYANGTYSINFEGFDSFTSVLGYRLVDKYVGTSVMVTPDTEYSFTIDQAIPGTSGDERFVLEVTTPVTLSFKDVIASQGEEFLLPVIADQFMEIYGSKISIEWDKAALSFVGVEELSYMAEGDFDMTNTADGVLILDYSALTPISLEDGSHIFAIRFEAQGGIPITDVTFGDVEVLGAGDIVLAYEAQDISINIAQEVNVLGNIATDRGETIKGVNVTMANETYSFESTTDENGDYAFKAFSGDQYTLSAMEGEGFGILEGLSVFDMVLTRLHLLGVRPFDSPYKFIAADVNNSKSVTILDIVEMGKVLLRWKQEFSGGMNWAYIPSEQDISADPFSYETSIDIALGDTDKTVDFVGVKLGDVNNSWLSYYAQRKSGEDFELSLENVALNGEFVEIPVTVAELRDIMGYQFTITWDPNELKYDAVEPGMLDGIFNEQFTANGILTTVWNDDAGNAVQLANGNTLFTLRLRTINKNASSLVEVNSSVTEALAIDNNLNAMSINATPAIIDLNRLTDGSLALFQNVPNPFDNNTQIDFRIAKEGLARLTVINALGELVYIHENNYKAGVYSLTWDRSQGKSAVSPGMYLYRLESNGEEVVKKMMIK